MRKRKKKNKNKNLGNRESAGQQRINRWVYKFKILTEQLEEEELFYFIFFKSKTCLSPGYHQQAHYGLFCCTSRNKADRLPISFACLMLGTPSRARRLRVACENIRCSSLFAAGNVSRETSPAAKSEEKRLFFAF